MRRIAAIVLPLFAITLVVMAAWNTAAHRDRRPEPGVLVTPVVDFRSATVAAIASAAPTAVPTVAVVHRVAAGDTLLGIAIQYDVEMEAIMAANELTDPNVLDIGQELIIPGIGVPTAVPVEVIKAALGPGGEAVPKPVAVTVNGLPERDIIQFSDEARQLAQETFARGQQLGRNPRAFTTAGDSTTEIPFFLARFDDGPYNLGEYAYLQPVIDYFHGSFNHDSVSVRVGLHSWTLFDPTWADKTICQPSEAPLPCEIRVQNPSVIFFRLGSNDTGVPALFDESMREAVAYALDQGVVPVIGTKADRGEGSDENNAILRQIATDYQLLLWDFDSVANTMPGRGLDVDNVHMTTFYAHDYTQPEAFQSGHAMHNLTALMVLDTIWKEVILAQS